MKKLITQQEIQTRIAELALEIEQHEDKYNDDQPPVFICILNGAFMFFTDLVKDMGIDVTVKSSFMSNRFFTCKII